MWRKNGIAKEVIALQWAVRTASWDFKTVKKCWAGALLSGNAAVCAKTIVKESRKFELARLKKKKKKEKILAVGQLLVQYFCDAI